MASKQSILGKAFEYACASSLANRCPGAVLRKDAALDTASGFFFNECTPKRQRDLSSGATAVVSALERLEPCLSESSSQSLSIGLQSDAKGIAGDVRDVVCSRGPWQIGISCKHNNDAVKHSRLSSSIDFGAKWLAHPCSRQYFDAIDPLFSRLDGLQKRGALWRDLPDKIDGYYVPILNAFMDELRRLNSQYRDVPERLVRYLIGRNDFYKVISYENSRATRLVAFNLAGTLNMPSSSRKPIVEVPVIRMPRHIYYIGFLESENGGPSDNTALVICDQGWEISLRIHNASSKVDPSLKFDVQLVSYPRDVYNEFIPWDA